MSQRKVLRLRLDPVVTDRLINAKLITAQDLLECPILTLMDITDLSYKDAVSLMSTVGARLVHPQTALEILQQQQQQQQAMTLSSSHHTNLNFNYSPLFVPSGVFGSSLDMGGGFPTGSISEICGPPGIVCAELLSVSTPCPNVPTLLTCVLLIWRQVLGRRNSVSGVALIS